MHASRRFNRRKMGRAGLLGYIALLLVAVISYACDAKDRGSPWVLVFRDTQDEETFLDVIRLSVDSQRILFYISSRNRNHPGRFLYQTLLLDPGDKTIRTVDSLVILSSGRIESEPADTAPRNIGNGGLDGVLYDLLCPEGALRPLDEVWEHARSVENVLKRLGS